MSELGKKTFKGLSDGLYLLRTKTKREWIALVKVDKVVHNPTGFVAFDAIFVKYFTDKYGTRLGKVIMAWHLTNDFYELIPYKCGELGNCLF
jgi:hypothetical protein